MKILVIGYYNKGNLGDDAYQGVMDQFFPNSILEFIGSRRLSTIKSEDYDAIVVGGGDIINDYFNNDIQPFLKNFKGPKIAFSIGIPFPSLINDKYLGHFDHVFTRNYEDLRDLQKLLGSHRAHFVPDIALAYKPSRPHKSITTDASGKLNAGERGFPSFTGKVDQKKCGVFLVGNLMDFPKIVEDIGHLIGKVALTHDVVLYCFNPTEDTKISEHVRDVTLNRLNNSHTDDTRLNGLLSNAKNGNRIVVDTNKYTAQEMIDIMTELDFAVCMRYHSHIFCTVAGTPFMSISSTRKTRSYMKQAGLTTYQYEIPLNAYGTPIDSSYEEMRKICSYTIKDRGLISERIRQFLEQTRFLLSSKQAYRLLSVNKTDVRNGVADFIRETEDHQNAARLLSNYVIGYPDSPYVWGMYEKFKVAGEDILDVIHDSTQYLLYHGAILKNEFFDLIKGDNIIPLSIDLREYQSYRGAHRGGWYLACEELYKLSSVNEKGDHNGIICDMYVDRTFHWAGSYMSYQGAIPYTSPWCGFVHHTPDTTYSNYNTEALFRKNEFIQSLHTCVALFTLSEPLSKFLREKLASIAPHIKVITFAHPVVNPDTKFTPKHYIHNKEPKLINIGAWLRNPFTIYRVPDIPLEKAILMGKDMKDHVPPDYFNIAYGDKVPSGKISLDKKLQLQPKLPCRPEPGLIPRWVLMLTEWLRTLGIHSVYYDNGTLYIKEKHRVNEIKSKVSDMIKKVTTIQFQSNDEYDNMLSQNIVFLDLIDAAAVNTIIECIVRKTPVVINKIPGTAALLGENYPMFYQNVDEIPALLSRENIEKTYKYINKLDTKRYQMSYFIDHMIDVSGNLVK
ncbi:Polysaccharide pyruvyl transferase [uncultured virus]|nr:Polysaccharide pyruvyl transferase [uncultured virus]